MQAQGTFGSLLRAVPLCRCALDISIRRARDRRSRLAWQGLRCTAAAAEGAVAKEKKLNSSSGSRKSGQSAPQRQSASQISTQPPRGTRDFPPDEMRLRSWLFAHWSAVSMLFGFESVDAPVLESEELFVRKAGEEITEQLFNFEDKGGRRMALRPEFTPSLARMVMAKGSALPLPAKWWTIAQCWRFERSTRGRRREHYQWNMDIIGVESCPAEAELLAALVVFLRRVGLSSSEIQIRVSSRRVLQAVLESAGVPANLMPSVFVIVDKMDKMPKEKVQEQLLQLGVDVQAAARIFEVMSLESIDQLTQLLGSDASAVQELQQLWRLAEGYGYQDWLTLDVSIVRGLAYYTGIVFEVRDRAGQLRAVAGGGRYDRLLSTFGGQDQPCAGFGFGDAVIMELLSDHGLLPSLQHSVDFMVVALDDALRSEACRLAARLRQCGQRVDLQLESRKLAKTLKAAERQNAAHVVLLGQKEWEQGMVRVKDMEARDERDVSLEELYNSFGCTDSDDEQAFGPNNGALPLLADVQHQTP